MKLRFRAWLKKKQEMDNKIDHISWLEDELYCIGDGITYMVSAEDLVLMQSTDMVDKNGKEIFEGDIVKCSGLLGTIESFKAMWICSFVKYNNYQKVGFFAQEIEVVGNIYENPELLEDKE